MLKTLLPLVIFGTPVLPCLQTEKLDTQLLVKSEGGCPVLKCTLSAVTVPNISPMPMICGPLRFSFNNTTPNSDAVTGSTMATIEAMAGAVCFRPMI